MEEIHQIPITTSVPSSLITGPAASLLQSRLQLQLTILCQILESINISDLHIFINPASPPSIRMTSQDGRRWGGYRCGPQGALLSEPPTG